MLNHELRSPEGILALYPDGPLAASDFTVLAQHVDAHVAEHGPLRGVLIRAPSFPGWKNFGAVLAHMKFVREHLPGIEKVAVVANGVVANTVPNMAGHFINAQVRHFEFEREDAAWDWLRNNDGAQMRPGSGVTDHAAIRQ